MQNSLFYVTVGPDPVTKLHALKIIYVILIMVCDVMMICECLKYYDRKY